MFTSNDSLSKKISSNKKIATKLITTSSLLASMLFLTSTAHAETTGYDQISFQAEAKKEVVNDQIQATLYKQIQAKSAKSLANQLNSSINNALKIAKRYPTVSVTTGRQNTYPQYNKQNKITGWTGRASINIKSTNLEETSKLIAKLQDSLLLEGINFGISEKKRDALKKQLTVKVASNFQQQANILSKAWGARGYRVVKVSLNSNNNYHPQPIMETQARFFSKSAATQQQNFSAGNSKVSVIANGTIELIR